MPEYLPLTPKHLKEASELATDDAASLRKLKKISARVWLGVMLIILIIGMLYGVSAIRLNNAKTKQIGQTEKEKNLLPNPNEDSIDINEGVASYEGYDCITSEWSDFRSDTWTGLGWFSISNNVWTIANSRSQKDAVAYYKTDCINGRLFDLEIVPREEKFLNLNVYHRGQLRWEVGGSDNRSIRLWKNDYGCSSGEVKHAVMLEESYLPNHDSILANTSLFVHYSEFYLPNGKIRSEIKLTYSSKNANGKLITTGENAYYHDFESGAICDLNHLPDINEEPYQFGLGLQKSEVYPDIVSRFEPVKFKISEKSYKD